MQKKTELCWESDLSIKKYTGLLEIRCFLGAHSPVQDAQMVWGQQGLSDKLFRLLTLLWGKSGRIPSQRASDVENVSMPWHQVHAFAGAYLWGPLPVCLMVYDAVNPWSNIVCKQP